MRPNNYEYFLTMARLVASRGTCYRRKVGTVLVDKDNHVIGTGRNGVPSGFPHCNEADAKGLHKHLCSGALSASGTDLMSCKAVHAEINALISCRHPEDIDTAYSTASPCLGCVRALLNTSCRRIVFIEEYPHPDAEREWRTSHPITDSWLHVQLSDDLVAGTVGLSQLPVSDLRAVGVKST